MSRGYRLTAEAQSSVDTAVRVLEALEHAFEQLAATPEIGHKREDLTARPVKFWSVYSYLIVYDPRARRSRSSPCCTAREMSNAS